jgi:hypothetical protein
MRGMQQSRCRNPKCQNPNDKQITDVKDLNAKPAWFRHLYSGLDLAFELHRLPLPRHGGKKREENL